MKIWTDKSGDKLDAKEFIERMGEGIKEITPLQQTISQINSTWVMIIGITGGLIVTIKNFKSYWWMTLILGAALFNTAIQLLGLIQKRKTLRKMEQVYDEADEPEEPEEELEIELEDIEKELEGDSQSNDQKGVIENV